MATPSDPYKDWLGIPLAERPPHHYRLLGIPTFEEDARVIDLGASRQSEKLRQAAAGGDPALVQKLLLEISKAKACLLNPARKQRYDIVLRAKRARVKRKKKRKRIADRAAQLLRGTPGIAAGGRIWTIGRSPQCDLVVDELGVSRHHCRLIQAEHGIFLEDLRSRNGTYLNGRRIASPVAVCRADDIRLGPKAAMPWPNEIPLSDVRLVRIGRAADNDFVLSLPTVSAHHALLRIEPGSMVLEDLGSRNGTALGRPGNKIRRVRVALDDIAYLGSRRVPIQELVPKSGD
jgi:pSer/pThr/pTyr-binding forkhead associated (FHA) protein